MRIETGGVDQHVQPDMRPIGHDYAVRPNAGDLAFDDVCVRELHRFVIVPVGLRDTRAAQVVVGREVAFQLGVAVLALHRLALRPGFEAPAVGFVDQLPQPVLLAPIAKREPQP